MAQDAKPTLKDLLFMSYTSEDGRTVHFRLMDRIKPLVTRLAIALNFPQHIIANLKTEQDPVSYLLTEWLRGGNQEEHDSRPLTWGTLITALRAAGLLEEVKILEQHFVAAPSVTERGAAIGVRKRRSIETDSSGKKIVTDLPPVGSTGPTGLPGSVAVEENDTEDLSAPETKRLKLASTDESDGVQQSMDNPQVPGYARIILPQVDTSLPSKLKITKKTVAATDIHKFVNLENGELEEYACKILTNKICSLEKAQRQKIQQQKIQQQKRKTEINMDENEMIDEQSCSTPPPVLARPSTSVTDPTCSVAESQLASVTDPTCSVAESQLASPTDLTCPSQPVLMKDLTNQTGADTVEKKPSWRENALQCYMNEHPGVSMIKEKPSFLWDAKKRIKGKPQYEIRENDELGILHIISASSPSTDAQILALLYIGEEKGITFCDYVKKKGEESVTTRVTPDREWQQRVVPKVHKYCEYFDEQWKQVQLQYTSK